MKQNILTLAIIIFMAIFGVAAFTFNGWLFLGNALIGSAILAQIAFWAYPLHESKKHK